MKKLIELGDRYAAESSWRDFAVVKFCLFALGVIVGASLPEEKKKPAIIGAFVVYLATYIPLMIKVFLIMKEMIEEEKEEELEEAFEDDLEDFFDDEEEEPVKDLADEFKK